MIKGAENICRLRGAERLDVLRLNLANSLNGLGVLQTVEIAIGISRSLVAE
jgi:hypothetical protein